MRYKAQRLFTCRRCRRHWAQPDYYVNMKCPYCGGIKGNRYVRSIREGRP